MCTQRTLFVEFIVLKWLVRPRVKTNTGSIAGFGDDARCKLTSYVAFHTTQMRSADSRTARHGNDAKSLIWKHRVESRRQLLTLTLTRK